MSGLTRRDAKMEGIRFTIRGSRTGKLIFASLSRESTLRTQIEMNSMVEADGQEFRFLLAVESVEEVEKQESEMEANLRRWQKMKKRAKGE